MVPTLVLRSWSLARLVSAPAGASAAQAQNPHAMTRMRSRGRNRFMAGARSISSIRCQRPERRARGLGGCGGHVRLAGIRILLVVATALVLAGAPGSAFAAQSSAPAGGFEHLSYAAGPYRVTPGANLI